MIRKQVLANPAMKVRAALLKGSTYAFFLIVQELCESRGGRPGLSVLTSLLASVDVKYIEPCFGIGLSLSLICQLTSEDIKQHFIIIYLLCISNLWYTRQRPHSRRNLFICSFVVVDKSLFLIQSSKIRNLYISIHLFVFRELRQLYTAMFCHVIVTPRLREQRRE